MNDDLIKTHLKKFNGPISAHDSPIIPWIWFSLKKIPQFGDAETRFCSKGSKRVSSFHSWTILLYKKVKLTREWEEEKKIYFTQKWSKRENTLCNQYTVTISKPFESILKSRFSNRPPLILDGLGAYRLNQNQTHVQTNNKRYIISAYF